MSVSRSHYFIAAALFSGLISQSGPAYGQTSSQSDALRIPPDGITRQVLAVDDNRDGAISRNEWRGTAQLFRDYDWNDDGLLSGTELRSGVWRNGRWEAEAADAAGPSFASLDRNRDGRLARSEWRDSRAAFNRLDVNRDGFLTRRELRTGTTNIGDDRFANLDSNRNGVISLSEWNSTRRSFAERDQNGDGVLTRREFAAAPGVRGDATRTSRMTREIFVDSRTQWTDTGVYVQAGDVVTVDASGTIRMSNDDSDTATPAGSVKGRRASRAPLRDSPAGALIFRVGSAVRFVGANGSIAAPVSGQLFLGVNDDHFSDNSGDYRVMLSIDNR